MHKKLILNPTKDTITICIPTEWVGKPLTCILKSAEYDIEDMYTMVSEDAIRYQRLRYSHRRRRTRSRRRRR